MDCSRRCVLKIAAAGATLAILPACGGPTAVSVPVVDNKGELTFSQFPQVASSGGGALVDLGGVKVIVIRTGDADAVALSALCTHEGCLMDYVGGSRPIECGCHGSVFSAMGGVLQGPAQRSLPSHPASVESDRIVVTLA